MLFAAHLKYCSFRSSADVKPSIATLCINCFYAEAQTLLIVMLSPVMLDVVGLGVVGTQNIILTLHLKFYRLQKV